MKTIWKFFILVLCLSLMAGCTQATLAPTPTNTPVPPTSIPLPPTATPIPPTPTITPVTLAGEFTDTATGIKVSYPKDWTAVSNVGSIGVTELSADWTGIVVFTLIYENTGTVATELTAMQDALTSGKDFAGVAVTPGQNANVYGKDWDAYSWKGNYTAVSKDYAGLDTVVPYGTDFLRITAYAPTDQWAQYEPTFAAILGSLVEPAADYAYIPPVKTTGWATYTSTEYGLSLSYPSDWIAPTAPWEGNGIWLNSADYLTSMVIWVKDGTDPAKMLSDWEATIKSGKGIFPTATVTDGTPIKVLGTEYPTKTCVGKNAFGTDINCGVIEVPYNGKMLEIVWYATSGDNWKKGQDIFSGIFSSMLAWKTYTSDTYKLSVSYPSTWIDPTAPWEGEGIWLNSADYLTSVVIWVVDGTDQAKMLSDWEATILSGKGIFSAAKVEDGQPVTILGKEYATKSCTGKNAFGSDIQCGVTYVPYNSKMLYILWYAATGDPWTLGLAVFPGLLTSIKTP